MSDGKSRTQKKQDDRALQKIGEQLLTLPNNTLESLDLPEELKESVMSAREIRNHGARRRQLQYIGVLMREMDTVSIQAILETVRKRDAGDAILFQQIEKWRDELKSGNLSCIRDILDNCPHADPENLATLAKDAQRESTVGKSTKSSRMLFRYLKQCLERDRNHPNGNRYNE